MNKSSEMSRRVFGRQLAVELPEKKLAKVAGGDAPVETDTFSTCDGTVTHDPRSGRDCTGTTDDVAFPPI
ncbi:MAG TPA: hypothetical protein VH988_07450 [Thermoanaerobaculia bacterium]|jgi:hypothetical protein|nr:hypothetical protein [Thermoanaerobaculia bacterium]